MSLTATQNLYYDSGDEYARLQQIKKYTDPNDLFQHVLHGAVSIMNDGSRHFGALPQTVLSHELRDHIGRMLFAPRRVTSRVVVRLMPAWMVRMI